jgi:hypothetical protein
LWERNNNHPQVKDNSHVAVITQLHNSNINQDFRNNKADPPQKDTYHNLASTSESSAEEEITAMQSANLFHKDTYHNLDPTVMS